MRIAIAGVASALYGVFAAAEKAPRPVEEHHVQQIAIIGAGAAGSSAAFHLRQFADERGVPVNITVFEKTERIGGRTLTVDVYDDRSQPAELGASIFIRLNHILWNATERFGLHHQEPELGGDGLLAIWDGDKFVYQQEEGSWYWWNIAKLFWKYGMSPYRTQKLMQGVIAKFLKLYEEPYFPFPSLSARAQELELTYITGQTGAQFLTQNKISEKFSHDIIQASTRVNYASNLAYIHGLETMVSMAPEGAAQVAGGNWQIFSNMVAASGAYIAPNTSVSGIELGATGKYSLKAASWRTGPDTEVLEEHEFDEVVIATPFQFSDIKTGDGVLPAAIDEIPYIKLHVTLFASPFRLSASFFNLEPGAQVPTAVLTTLSDGEKPDSGVQGAGKAGFYSISTLKTVRNPTTKKNEFLYKIFSPEKVTSEFLTSLLGVEVPGTVTESTNSDGSEGVVPVSWYYPHSFYSYPKELPRVTFQDPILADGLYYTSGVESFISTMETSALMGMNVARLIVDDLSGGKTSGKDGSQSDSIDKDADDQRVLADGGMSTPKADTYTVDEL